MLLIAGAVVLAAVVGLARRWGSGTGGEEVGRPFTLGTIGLLLLGAAGAALGDRQAGGTGLSLLEVGLGLLAVGCAAATRVRAGFALMAIGVLANLAVISVNGGMPVRDLPPAAPAAHHHHGVSSRDRLVNLSDGIGVAGQYVSPGDLAVAAGAAVAFFSAIPRRRSVTELADPRLTPTSR